MRQDVEFNAEGTTLRGWWFTPEAGAGPYPTVVATHGFGATKEMGIAAFAEAFAAAGMACLVYDHRNLGASDGEPRQEIDPWAQVADYRHAITYVSGLDEADADRIGIFGTSYSGGHVIAVAAWDRRVKCVYSQVPHLSGALSSARLVRSDKKLDYHARFEEDRARRFAGEEPARIQMMNGDPDGEAAMPNREGSAWFAGIDPDDLEGFRNDVTLRSIEMFWEYEPALLVDQVSPTPLMMVVMDEDVLTQTDAAYRTYELALQPKRLVSLPGGHFEIYNRHLEKALELSASFFAEHLVSSSSVPAGA
jgi:fermentation-respiration switch protein FrsA (DUF1100 family)